MTRAKSALNMMMMSFVAIGNRGHHVGPVGRVHGHQQRRQLLPDLRKPVQPLRAAQLHRPGDLLKVGYAATFAIITVALISGAVADRAKFSAWVIFTPIWATLVYAPLAFMVWGGGLFSKDGWFGQTFAPVIDFAGGTVVHINAGIAGLILVLVIGNRRGFGKDPNHRPHNIPFVMLGAAILWFGWFGFNAGAAATVEQAGLIWINTLAAPAAAMLGWLAVERFRDGHPTSLGAASGVVAGLVAITPACANVSPLGAIALGAVAGVASALAVGLKFKFGYDDSLDVVGVHLVSGVVGTVAIGFLATPSQAPAGLFYGGGSTQLVAQVLAAVFSIIFTAVMTFIIAFPIHKLMASGSPRSRKWWAWTSACTPKPPTSSASAAGRKLPAVARTDHRQADGRNRAGSGRGRRERPDPG